MYQSVILKINHENTPIGQFIDTKKLFIRDNSHDIPRGEPCHLYIVIEDAIKKNDWIIYNNEEVLQVLEVNDNSIKTTNDKLIKTSLCQKVISSTDDLSPELKMSEWFLYDFVKLWNNNI